MSKIYMPRILDTVLDDYLEAFGAVLIKGPKWCGKKTTAEMKAKSVLKMQDSRKQQDYLKLADTSPYILLEGETPRLIDEWQMAPILWDAVRTEVDDRQETGQFILTGSSVPKDNEIIHSGTGRISTLNMRPMSLYESSESNGLISLSDIFENRIDLDGVKSNMTIKDLSFVICRGGWPSTIGKKQKIALMIAKDYINSICEADVSRIDGSAKDPERVRALLRSYARNISSLASNKTILDDIISNDALMSEQTLYLYLNILKRLFVIDEVPAWCPAIRSKTAMRSSNKKEFVDPSLGIAALGLTPEQLLLDFNTFGFFFEALCIRDLKIYSQSLEGSVYYYHDRYGLEADAVIRLNDGRYGLIEIKLGSKEIDEGAQHLNELRNLIIEHKMIEPNFLMVLTGGEVAYRRSDNVLVVPLACLKN